YGEPTACHRDTRCSGTWKFDAFVSYDVHREFQFIGDSELPSGNAPTRGWTLGEHESGHVRDVEYVMSILDGVIQTEGFKSKVECESARWTVNRRLGDFTTSEMERLNRRLDGP